MNKFTSEVTRKHITCYFFYIKSSCQVQCNRNQPMWPMLINQWDWQNRTTLQLLQSLLPWESRGLGPCVAEMKNNEGQAIFLLQYFLNVQLLPNNLSNSLDASLRAHATWRCVKSTNAPRRINKRKCSPRGVQSDAGFYLQYNSCGSHSLCSWFLFVLCWITTIHNQFSWMGAIKQRTLSNTGLSYLEGCCQ